jgi:hypothetical protein
MSVEDILGFARTYAGKNIRSVYDPEDESNDEGNSLQITEGPKEPKHRPKQKSMEVFQPNPASGTPGTVKRTAVTSRRRVGQGVACHFKSEDHDQSHPQATHIFHTPSSSTIGGVGFPLCPKHLSEEQEHLANWRKDNPDIYVKSPEPITPDVENRIVHEQAGMSNDVKAVMSAGMIFHHGVSPEDERSWFGQMTPYAGAGRTPGTTKPLPAQTRTPEYKETALNTALERARKGMAGRNWEELSKEDKQTLSSGKTPEQLAKIGEEQEEKRKADKENYFVGKSGVPVRSMLTLGESAEGRRKGIARGNYVKPHSERTDTPIGKGNAPIDNVMKAVLAHHKSGKKLDRESLHSIIEQHGEGVVTPNYVLSSLQTKATPKVSNEEVRKKQQPLPISRRAGAFSRYMEEVSGAGMETHERNVENEDEDWQSYLSRNNEFNGGRGL